MTTNEMTPASPMKLIFWHLALAVSARLLSRAGPADVAFSQSSQSVQAYDFVEVTLNVSKPDAGNPFTDVTVQGHFEKTSGADKLSVTGFCDASDGSVFRIRFMPASEGDYFLSSVSAALILDFTSSTTSTTGAPENSGKGGSSAQ